MMRPLLLISLIALLVGCGGAPYRPDYSQTEISPKLLGAYHEWDGVPYRYGGMSQDGVDCSGLVFRVFDDLYDRRLPRTTQALLTTGQKVSRAALQPADLVFFRTSWKDRHVGIYLGQGKFMHASTSRGVMISSLLNPYWQQHYLTSRRVLIAP